MRKVWIKNLMVLILFTVICILHFKFFSNITSYDNIRFILFNAFGHNSKEILTIENSSFIEMFKYLGYLALILFLPCAIGFIIFIVQNIVDLNSRKEFFLNNNIFFLKKIILPFNILMIIYFASNLLVHTQLIDEAIIITSNDIKVEEITLDNMRSIESFDNAIIHIENNDSSEFDFIVSNIVDNFSKETDFDVYRFNTIYDVDDRLQDIIFEYGIVSFPAVVVIEGGEIQLVIQGEDLYSKIW